MTFQAIEGAIGSKHKIDASYLSPHVNMASRLEAATKQVQHLLLSFSLSLSLPLSRLFLHQTGRMSGATALATKIEVYRR